MKTLFVSDLDGTLLRSDETLSQFTINTINELNKVDNPRLFEAGTSGSILKGESPYQGAVRELKEETGIDCDDLTFIYAQSDMMIWNEAYPWQSRVFLHFGFRKCLAVYY